RHALPAHGAFSKVAHGQEAGRLHIRPTRSHSTAGVGRNFRQRPVSLENATGVAHATMRVRNWLVPLSLLREITEAVHSLFFEARSVRPLRHSRVGSSSGSGVSWDGRSASGTWRRFTRIRVHVDERPLMESTSTSSM